MVLFPGDILHYYNLATHSHRAACRIELYDWRMILDKLETFSLAQLMDTPKLRLLSSVALFFQLLSMPTVTVCIE